MSLIITTFVSEGIVLSSDSRISLSNNLVRNITQSDTLRKTFVTSNGVGISTCGQADIKGVLLSKIIDSFIDERLNSTRLKIEEVTDKLIEYFNNLGGDLDIIFHIAGYDIIDNQNKQRVFRVNIKTNLKEEIFQNSHYNGLIFDGFTNTVAKLINPVIIQKNNQSFTIPFQGIAYNFFTLQDAIDFNRFLTKSTIDAMKFELIEKIVAEPIDVLVIKPNEYIWINKKDLK